MVWGGQPGGLSTLTLLGDIYMNNEVAELALDAYLSAADLATSDDSQAIVRAADLLTRTANYEQAEVMIAKCRSILGDSIENEDDLRLLTMEAKIARAAGEDDKAAEILVKIIERDALNGDAIIELANYYADMGDMPKAINRFQQAEKIEAHERAALVAHAQARVRNGEYKEAVPLLRRALQLKSDRNLADYTDRVERAARSQG